VDQLIGAMDRISSQYNVKLGIIGDGPEKQHLEARRDSMDNPECIDFLGFLDEYERVLGHMRACDIFVSPSTREGFGLTFAEAMAADCSVIAGDHPDSAADEVIGNAGFLSKPTVGCISETVEMVLSGKKPEVEPRERAQRFDWDNVASQAEDAYRSVI